MRHVCVPGFAMFSVVHAASKPNVMYIIADDLNPSAFPSYGQPDYGITPNLDKLASEAVTFMQAHSQVAICGPSRNSFLTGMRPDKAETYTFQTSFRNSSMGGSLWLTLPQWMAQNGYRSCGAGKTFHDDETYQPNVYDMASGGWSLECGPYYVSEHDNCPSTARMHAPLPDWAAGLVIVDPPDATVPIVTAGPNSGMATYDTVAGCVIDQAEDNFEDSRVVKHILKLAAAAMSDGVPFFMVAGLRRPHTPWAISPSTKLVAKQVPLATNQKAPINMPIMVG